MGADEGPGERPKPLRLTLRDHAQVVHRWFLDEAAADWRYRDAAGDITLGELVDGERLEAPPHQVFNFALERLAFRAAGDGAARVPLGRGLRVEGWSIPSGEVNVAIRCDRVEVAGYLAGLLRELIERWPEAGAKVAEWLAAVGVRERFLPRATPARGETRGDWPWRFDRAREYRALIRSLGRTEVEAAADMNRKRKREGEREIPRSTLNGWVYRGRAEGELGMD